jgi:Protein of unknown function (DUF3017)
VRHSAQHRAPARASRPPQPDKPDGAGEPGRRRWLDRLPYAIVLCGLAGALIWIRQGGQSARSGTLAVAGTLLAAALARLALPERRAGMLVSRRRLLDVAVLAMFGVGLLVAGLVLPPQT